ncbi:IS256 family transposase [Cetobacterium sp.]|uniref:IS256 family transposase n=1 Tax=Cetobacterium sp. TaxID=2071632 RepID=UPI003F2B1996
MKIMIEEFYQGELEEELGYTKCDYRNKDFNNSRNGYSSKKLKSSAGEIKVNVPRDRNGEYEPQVMKKHQNIIGEDLEVKIISMYAKRMTTSDIESHIEEIYGYQVSDSSITRITNKILPLVKEWQTRPLETVYPIVFMDAIHYHIRSEGQIVKKAVYIAIGISSSGEKDVIGMWVRENESAKFWLSKLNELKSRGVEDILIACVDGLTGFANAIEAVCPQTQIQQYIIHQIRSSTQFVSIKALIADLKLVYKASTEENMLLNLESFDEKWGKKYPKIAISWKNNWLRLSTYFKYPQEIRTLIYTTNTIEEYNRQLRKVTKTNQFFQQMIVY